MKTALGKAKGRIADDLAARIQDPAYLNAAATSIEQVARMYGALTSAEVLKELYAAAMTLGVASPMLNSNQVSELFGISKSYLCELTRDGEIPGAVRIGSLWRYRSDEILKMIIDSGA